MMKAIIKPLVFGLVCVFAGYQIAVFTQSPILISAVKEQAVQPEKSAQAINNDVVRNARTDESFNASQLNSNADLVNSHIETNTSVDDLSSLVNDDLDGMLARLEELRAEGANGQMIKTQFELLKQFLSDNPENIDNLLGQLGSHSANSGSFSTLLSLIKTLPTEQTELAMLSFAEQYAGAFDKESQDKLLAVLSTTSEPIESEYITRSLIDMATIGETDIDTRLEALSLVRSYQLSETEKNDISKKISQLLNNGNDSNDYEAARLVPHLIRFSNKEQRSEIASNLLSQNSTAPIRNEVLSSINSGEVPANDEMKKMLFDIAADSNDPLNHEVVETLRYSFELNRLEFSRLTAY